MNDLEKRSFYSFLGLYIVSSLLFISMIGYWYYIAQKSTLERKTYYQLQHASDLIAGDIILAQMRNQKLKKSDISPNITLALIDIEGNLKDGEILVSDIELKKGYFTKDGYNIFISDTTKEHLGIMYVITQSSSLKDELVTLQRNIFIIFIVIFIFIAIIALILSKIFMRPIAQKVKEIESFINDVTHELNTPITALSISSDRAIKESYCSPKTIKNISISTKQLYDIYRSLTYLNFSSTRDEPTTIDISQTLKESISYYQPLCDSKYIRLNIDIEECMFDISISRLQLLYGNLIGNAIKYSTARSDITIRLKNGVFSIKDNGIGIEESRQKDIFKKFQRCTTYSGGFGVGLYIVKSICDEYNIDIKLNSKPMEGSEFIVDFSLPLKQ
jgi:two-component system OmpR family sensor kinase